MPYTPPDFATIRERMLRDARNLDPTAPTGGDSDLFIRSSCTASAVEGLYDYQSWLARQLLPDTADTEHLEAHAGLRGIVRKVAVAASGTATFTGISYLSICKAALLPAVLYYLSLFTMIHFEALRHGLGGTPPDLIPELRSIKRKLYYLAPLALLIVLMIAGRSIIFSALLACAAVVALSFLSPETRLTPARFLAAMENAAANLLMIAACCACVGIVIGVVTMTGPRLRARP